MSKFYFPHLIWVRSFEASARHLNFTLAARELGLTQAAVSKHVKHLELYLGAPLFERKARTLELTNAGRAYLPKVQDSFSRLTMGTQEVFGQAPRKRLTLRAIASFAANWLVPRLPAFQALHPDIELRILTSTWAASMDGADFDLDIRYGTGNWPGLRADALGEERIYPIANKAVAARLNAPEDLQNERLIHVIGYQEGWQDWLGAMGLSDHDFQSEQVDSSHVAYEMARAGLGVALGRETLAAGLLEAGELLKPFAFEQPIDEKFYLLSKPDDPHVEVELFRDWLLSVNET